MHEDLPALRIYLDANVLISASLSTSSQFLNLWRMKNIHPVTSLYAVYEARRNLYAMQLERFDFLISNTKLCPDPNPAILPIGVHVVEKDRAILAAALSTQADYLLTGDKRHFRHLYSNRIEKTMISSPADFLNQYGYRLKRLKF